jgi:hypothetical protein
MFSTSKNVILEVSGWNLRHVLLVLYKVCLDFSHSLQANTVDIFALEHYRLLPDAYILAVHDFIPTSFTEPCEQAVSIAHLEVPSSFLSLEAGNHDCGCSSVLLGKERTSLRDFQVLVDPIFRGRAVQVLLHPWR